jgi:hypothetical protein
MKQRQNNVMKTPPTEVAFDYLFELVVQRTGHYFMSNLSLEEWKKESPRMLSRLAARNIRVFQYNHSTVLITRHGSSNLFAN